MTWNSSKSAQARAEGLGTGGVNLKCIICTNLDMKWMVETAYNSRKTFTAISHAFGGTPGVTLIKRHVSEHRTDGWTTRDIDVADVRSTRVRIEDLQLKLLDEIESRIQWAEERAYAARDAGNPDASPADWYDILAPKNQAAIASALKMQEQTDKREQKKATVAVDLIKLMGGVAPPSHLIEDGVTIEGEVTEDDAPAE